MLQRSKQVTLRWNLPRGQYRAEIWCNGIRTWLSYPQDPTLAVAVEPGQTYKWVLSQYSPRIRYQGSFTVASDLCFSADGQDGNPGRSGPGGTDGQPGRSGGKVEAELRRQPDGMHLFIQYQGRHCEYLFVEPGLRFKLSARGGNGGDGADGVSGYGQELARGRDGGGAGWGGYLVITTHDCPWRDFLDVDLSPGKPGVGGKGEPDYRAPDGHSGKAGQPGRVETHLGE
ncbi:hypothetical protein JST97_32970 [bacterium]|nr:hypothetical protein [bacterium]